MAHLNQCSERSGFLFKHDCQKEGTKTCQRCNKQICENHSRYQGDTLSCVSCLKASGESGNDSRQRWKGGQRHSSYDPYFYGYHYYSGWGHYHGGGHGGRDHSASVGEHDSNDFTEADGATMEQVGDEGFETDMEGS